MAWAVPGSVKAPEATVRERPADARLPAMKIQEGATSQAVGATGSHGRGGGGVRAEPLEGLSPAAPLMSAREAHYGLGTCRLQGDHSVFSHWLV